MDGKTETKAEVSEYIHGKLMCQKVAYVFICSDNIRANVDAQGFGAMVARAIILGGYDDFDVNAGFQREVIRIKEKSKEIEADEG